MTGDAHSLPSPEYKDRSTGLIVFGLLQIALGCLAASMVPLMLLPLTSGGAGGGPTLQMMIPAMGIYALAAVVFFCLGVGSILARRWARDLTLVLAWIWLVIGAGSFLAASMWMPNMFNMAGQDHQLPPQAMIFVQVIVLTTLSCVYVVLPGILVLFYQSKHVKATCQNRDRHVRWTEKCPLPVLSLSLLLGFGGCSAFLMLGYGPVILFFGAVLKGAPAVLVILCVAVLSAWLAWATYKLRIVAWWMALSLYVGFYVSAFITFARVDLMEFYRQMKVPEEQLKLIENSGMLELIEKNMPFFIIGSMVVLVGYLLWVRRYFVRHALSSEGS